MNNPPKSLCFQPLSPSMLKACAVIAQSAPDPWSMQDLQAALDGSPNRFNLVACSSCITDASAQEGYFPLGFACFLGVHPTVDLQMIAVHPQARKMGVGKQLLEHSLQTLQKMGFTQCLLEVRASNISAIGLYQKLGFTTLAKRPGMYTHPVENGLLMARKI